MGDGAPLTIVDLTIALDFITVKHTKNYNTILFHTSNIMCIESKGVPHTWKIVWYVYFTVMYFVRILVF